MEPDEPTNINHVHLCRCLHEYYCSVLSLHLPNRFMAFFRDHLDDPVPEGNLRTLCWKGRLTD